MRTIRRPPRSATRARRRVATRSQHRAEPLDDLAAVAEVAVGLFERQHSTAGATAGAGVGKCCCVACSARSDRPSRIPLDSPMLVDEPPESLLADRRDGDKASLA